MNKIRLTICSILFATGLYAQIRVNVPEDKVDEFAIFQLNNTDRIKKGFTLPRVQLRDKTSFNILDSEPKIGLMVFNTLKGPDLPIGVHSWTGTMWELSSNNKIKEYIEQPIDKKFLGYSPSYERPTNNSVTTDKKQFETINGQTAHATFVKCVIRSIPDLTLVEDNKRITNTYCIYNISGAESADVPLAENFTWYDAFKFAQSEKGHLLTITDDSEWDFLKENIFNEQFLNHPVANKKTWLGSIRMNDQNVGTVNLPTSNRDRMKFYWITNEKSISSWMDNRGYQTHYESGYPAIDVLSPLNVSNSALNNNDITNYAVYVTDKSTNPNRMWRTIDSSGVNQKIRSYNNGSTMVEMNPIAVNNDNTDDFKSVSVVVEYTNEITY